MDNQSNYLPMHESESDKPNKKDYALQATLYFLLKKRINHNYSFKPMIEVKAKNDQQKELSEAKTERQIGPKQIRQTQKSATQAKQIEGYKLFVTQICAVDPKDGSFKHYSGPHIVARDKHEAQGLIDNTGLGYCEILGELIGLIDNDGNDVKEAYRDN